VDHHYSLCLYTPVVLTEHTHASVIHSARIFCTSEEQVMYDRSICTCMQHTKCCIVLYEVGELLVKIRRSVHINYQTTLVARCSDLLFTWRILYNTHIYSFIYFWHAPLWVHSAKHFIRIHVNVLHCWLNFLILGITMTCAKNYETVCKCVKVIPRILWPLFSRTRCIMQIIQEHQLL